MRNKIGNTHCCVINKVTNVQSLWLQSGYNIYTRDRDAGVMQVFTQTNRRGSSFQHFITPTLIKSNNQPAYSPDPLSEQKSNKVASLDSVLHRRDSAQ